MGFPQQGYRSQLPFPPPGDLPNTGIEPVSPALQADSLALSHLRPQAKLFRGDRSQESGCLWGGDANWVGMPPSVGPSRG